MARGRRKEREQSSHTHTTSTSVGRSSAEKMAKLNFAKEAWEPIAAMCVGPDHAKKAMAQLLKQEYANLKFKDGESVEDFSLCLQSLISKLRSHGITILEFKVDVLLLK